MKYIRVILLAWGALSGVAVLAIGSYLFYQYSYGNTNKSDQAKIEEVRFVLNWANLGDDRIESVKHSYTSSRSLTGDHLDAYAIQITKVELSELKTKERGGQKWTQGDQANGVLKESIELVSSFVNSDKLNWFPSEEKLLSNKVHITSWSILLHDERVTAAKLTFVFPEKKMVYYASVAI